MLVGRGAGDMRVLVLHSGGMDSTTCLYEAHRGGAEVFSLGVDYGQRLSVELMYAQRQCDALGIERSVVSVSWRKPERVIPLNRTVDEMRASISPAFLPARNAILLSLACAHASGISADEVHTGLNCIDFSGYPDCTVEFFRSFTTMMNIANPQGPKLEHIPPASNREDSQRPKATLVAPLLNLSKVEIAKMARGLGIGENDTWSCYRPQITSAGIVPCRACDACRLHDHAWRAIEAS
jgi:7-cyano-7-deazaguanine synthase